jgi:hypothetical protein
MKLVSFLSIVDSDAILPVLGLATAKVIVCKRIQSYCVLGVDDGVLKFSFFFRVRVLFMGVGLPLYKVARPSRAAPRG